MAQIMPMVELSRRQLIETERVFQECDIQDKKYLDKSDIKVAVMMMLGYKISKDEVSQILSDYGSLQENGEKGLTLMQFRNAMKPKFATVDEDEQIRNAFLAFDRTCRGFLTVEDVKTVFKEVCPHYAEHRVELAFKEIDRDGDGRISYKDFDFMMKFNSLD